MRAYSLPWKEWPSLRGRPCEDAVRTQAAANQEENPLQKSSLLDPDLALVASSTVRNKFLSFKPPGLWHFVMATQANTDTK